MSGYGRRHESTRLGFNVGRLIEVLDASLSIALLAGVIGFVLSGPSWLVIGAVLGGAVASVFFGIRNAYGR